MTGLKISLLGSVQIVRDDRPATGPAYDKVRALLAYLMVESDRPHRRELLAELLWPDQPEGRGRHSLRQALVTLRHMVGASDEEPPLLLATRDSVRIHPDARYVLDIDRFNKHLQVAAGCDCDNDQSCADCMGQLQAAIDLYRGDFLGGLTVDASSEFDDWVADTREQLRIQVLNAAHELSDLRLQAGEFLQSADMARYQLARDPGREEAHRQLMLALYLGGDRRAALAQFDQCVAVLANELGIEPDDETIALRDAIHDRTLPMRRARGRQVRLPAQATPFIGRERELADIAALLTGSEYRLLTVTGAGGAGKTRLAIEAASRATDRFADGVVFVALAGLHSHEALISTLVDALFTTGVDRADPASALIRFVQERELLLVLDNFEQLVSASGVIADLLASAPSLRIMVTSRERLNLYEEWVIDLDGLSLPDLTNPEHQVKSDSVQLFIASAKRTNSRFTAGEAEIPAIARICSLVGGLPLALELAAASTLVLSVAEIAAEIEKSIDFLSTSYRNVPDRHRSMRAVFDQTWELLTPEERDVFARLSLFHGGFNRAGAAYVAGATTPGLFGLVGKSLLRRVADDRFEIHELLRQYGEAKLWAMSDAHAATADRHSEFFCSLLEEHERLLRGGDQHTALRTLTMEIENLRVAWRHAADRGDPDLLLQASHGLWIFLEVSSRYADIETLFTYASDRTGRILEVDPGSERSRLAHASILVRLGAVYFRIGDNQRGEALVREGCAILRDLSAPDILGLGLNFMGMFASGRGDYQNARSCLMESIAAFQEAGDRWGESYSTSDLGMVTFMLGDVAEAERLQQLARAMFTEIGDRRGLAFALHDQGVVASQAGHYDVARTSLRAALEIRRSLRHSWAVSTTLTQLGIVAAATGDPDEARAHLLLALQEARDVQSLPAMLAALTELAMIVIRPQSEDWARNMLEAVRQHPLIDSRLAVRVEELMGTLEEPAIGADTSADWSMEIEAFTSEMLKGGQPVLAR